MKELRRYAGLLILALAVGFGVYTVMPADAGAYSCGYGCSNAMIGCNGQGECTIGLYQYGVMQFGPPGVCNNMCSFIFWGCVDMEFC